MSRIDSIPAEFRQALEDAGYQWKAESGVWMNVEHGRAISFETVRDHDAAWLRCWLEEGDG